jgi:hypothetical protein
VRKAITLAGVQGAGLADKINIIRDDDPSRRRSGGPERDGAAGRHSHDRRKLLLMNDIALQERLQPDAPRAQAQEEPLDLLEYWRAISKRRWSILGLTCSSPSWRCWSSNNMRTVYRATATLLIEQGKSKVVSIRGGLTQGFAQREYYQTQAEILKSEELARKAVVKLNLASHPDCRQPPDPTHSLGIG